MRPAHPQLHTARPRAHARRDCRGVWLAVATPRNTDRETQTWPAGPSSTYVRAKHRAGQAAARAAPGVVNSHAARMLPAILQRAVERGEIPDGLDVDVVGHRAVPIHMARVAFLDVAGEQMHLGRCLMSRRRGRLPPARPAHSLAAYSLLFDLGGCIRHVRHRGRSTPRRSAAALTPVDRQVWREWSRLSCVTH